ncbi:serine--tRNA ligase [Rhodospirillum centenum]|uniref:Serine--tRNA ligase n=1 Tax=Rhodospirillum centenum (strain ATCC 51521 / SW) TaxID=414684 RepID=SYS_RHOCS|nr:serine--tRNA ligase [Rhodospirillum centenum]B6ISM1.1 RecName: Full=Serine--tRNA ligase; AltName: Full=Seryl-tRNA synthetase; Short=SerRS; AltName: Full=Seryl-tRNA(Ser/Sec) synthetase [Rhodospirillum centenum SW]ACI98457.1 seryl-tRNA synthetase SerS [Rhodospirillum centenum SW]
MHDLRAIRDNPEAFDTGLARRGLPPASAAILDLDQRRRAAQTSFQECQARRNEASRLIGAYKKDGKDAQPLLDEVAALKERIPALEEEDRRLGAELDALLAALPNLPAADVPEGKDEHDNVEIRRVGTPRDIPGAKQHFELGEALGLMDFEGAARMSGARFTVLKGQLARLERALGDFMLDLHTREFGYTEVSPPLLVRDEAVFGTGQLPKFADDLFRTTTGHWLIPTAEVTLTNLANDSIIDAEALPWRLTARTPCFRSEAGSAGKDTRGMIRQHQFMKVELVSITLPEQSEAEHERMTKAAETVLERLGLPFRTVVLCTGDMGFSARKTYDIEVWLPGQGAYREISSCSNCGDFQARRMKARSRPKGEKGTQVVHTLNGSGVAVGRALIAVMENYQQPDGSILVPEALRPYMGGQERITAHG